MSIKFLDRDDSGKDKGVDKSELVNEDKSDNGMIEVDENRSVYCLKSLVNSV